MTNFAKQVHACISAQRIEETNRIASIECTSKAISASKGFDIYPEKRSFHRVPAKKKKRKQEQNAINKRRANFTFNAKKMTF